jgi:hypothetical protein
MSGEVDHHLVNAKQHVASVTLLLELTVQLGPNVKVHGVDARRQIGANGAVGRPRLGPHEMLLALGIDLRRPVRDVIQTDVAENMIGRLGNGNVLRLAADDDRQLRLPIQLNSLVGAAGNGVERSGQGADRLQEDLRLRRRRHMEFFDMFLVVEAGRRDLPDPLDRGKIGEVAADGERPAVLTLVKAPPAIASGVMSDTTERKSR